MNLTLPNGGVIINATTITIDARGVITCTAEVISEIETTTECPGFAPKAEREARRLERAIEKSSEKSYRAAVIKAKQNHNTVRFE